MQIYHPCSNTKHAQTPDTCTLGTDTHPHTICIYLTHNLHPAQSLQHSVFSATFWHLPRVTLSTSLYSVFLVLSGMLGQSLEPESAHRILESRLDKSNAEVSAWKHQLMHTTLIQHDIAYNCAHRAHRAVFKWSKEHINNLELLNLLHELSAVLDILTPTIQFGFSLWAINRMSCHKEADCNDTVIVWPLLHHLQAIIQTFYDTFINIEEQPKVVCS